MATELTNHAVKRAKQRLSWNKHTLSRMSQKAIDEGVTRKDVSGRLSSWVEQKIKNHPDCAHVRIYGEVAFFFRGGLLVTMYQVPTKYKKHLSMLNNT